MGAWVTSLMSDVAGKWLTVVPKLDKYKFSNLEYITNLRFRLFMPAKNVCEGVRCSCKKRPVVDAYGHHLVTGCGVVDGFRHRIHDTMAHEFCSIASYCGLWVLREELGCFKLANPAQF